MPQDYLKLSEGVHEINLDPEDMNLAPEDMQADETRWTIEDEEGQFAGEFDPGWVTEDEPED
jgi:hypothetical protein